MVLHDWRLVSRLEVGFGRRVLLRLPIGGATELGRLPHVLVVAEQILFPIRCQVVSVSAMPPLNLGVGVLVLFFIFIGRGQ